VTIDSVFQVDPIKAAILKNSNGNVLFNSGFLLLADHYGFQPRAFGPRKARTKGKVDRMANYLKENLFVRYRQLDSFNYINQLVEYWLSTVADERQLRQFKQPQLTQTSIPVTSTSISIVG
jgi:transposase